MLGALEQLSRHLVGQRPQIPRWADPRGQNRAQGARQSDRFKRSLRVEGDRRDEISALAQTNAALRRRRFIAETSLDLGLAGIAPRTGLDPVLDATAPRKELESSRAALAAGSGHTKDGPRDPREADMGQRAFLRRALGSEPCRPLASLSTPGDRLAQPADTWASGSRPTLAGPSPSASGRDRSAPPRCT